MMSNLRVVEPAYSKQALELLNELLELAKRGEITEFTACYRVKDDPKGIRWAMTGCDNLQELIGTLETMKQKQFNRMFGK